MCPVQTCTQRPTQSKKKMSYMSLLIGKPYPDMKCVDLAGKPSSSALTLLSKTLPRGKTTVLCFVSKSLSEWETKAAVNTMEECAYQKKHATFVVVSCDSLENAKALHAELDLRLCKHVFAPGAGKEFGIKRTPAHFVLGANGRVIFQSEEDPCPFMTHVL